MWCNLLITSLSVTTVLTTSVHTMKLYFDFKIWWRLEEGALSLLEKRDQSKSTEESKKPNNCSAIFYLNLRCWREAALLWHLHFHRKLYCLSQHQQCYMSDSAPLLSTFNPQGNKKSLARRAETLPVLLWTRLLFYRETLRIQKQRSVSKMWLLIFLVWVAIWVGGSYWYLFGKKSPFSLESVRPPGPREFDQKKRDKVIKQGKIISCYFKVIGNVVLW